MAYQFRNLSFKNKLVLAFLFLSIGPMLLISSIFYSSFISSTQQQVYDNLYSVAQAKQAAITSHINNLRQQTTHHSETDFVNYSMSRFYGFSYAFGLISDDEKKVTQKLKSHYTQYGHFKNLPVKTSGVAGSYQQVHDRFHPGFEQFIQRSEFSDLLLVDLLGNVIYSQKKDHYFAANLNDPAYIDSPLGAAFQDLTASMPKPNPAIYSTPVKEHRVLSDFASDPITGHMQAYFINPIQHHSRVSGYVVYALPSESMTKLMAQETGLGEGAEVYVLNTRSQPISALRQLSTRDNAYNPLLIERPALEMPTVDRAILGESGIMQSVNYMSQPVLSAFGYVDVGPLRWVVIAEQEQQYAQAESSRFGKQILLIGSGFILIVIAMIYWLSRSLTKPLNSLISATESITYGDNTPPIIGVKRNDEIGRLASRFEVMAKAVSRQITVIRDKNSQLEQNVSVIHQQNEALRQADKIKDEFLANTSHELRTPLTGVIGISQSLLQGVAGPLNASQHEQLLMVQNGAQRLAHLVDDLLDFHKIKNNKLRLTLDAVDVKRCIDTVVALSRYQLSGKPVTLEVRLPQSNVIALADTARLEQVLYNLLSNAIKYTEHGSIILSLEEGANKQLIISVTDSGVGIAHTDQVNIFDPFVQVDASVTRAQNGSGLGLAISSQLVELMSGELTVQSEVGSGSCFSFNLPRFESHSISELDSPAQSHWIAPAQIINNISETNHSSTQDYVGQQEGSKVLVVDDEIMNLQVLKNQLELAGYQVVLCSQGLEALDYLRQNDVDLLILDLMMPQISGLSMLQEIRKQPNLSDLPVLLLTAKTQTKDLLQGFECGTDDYLTKPFLQHELLTRVSHLLKAKQTDQRVEENRLLKMEVAKRIESEAHLKEGQSRMQQLLENIDEAIISVNAFKQVIYVNPAALNILGFEAANVIGDDIGRFIGIEGVREIERRSVNPSINTSESYRNTNIELRCADGNLHAVQAQLFSSGQGQHQEWHLMLATHSTSSPAIVVNDESDFRKNLVLLMNEALSVWQKGTGKSKICLAEQSKIWSVYLDRSSAQTRTMDKYFLEQTLPKKPRWRDVLRTASYVTHHVDKTEHFEAIKYMTNTSAKIKEYLESR